MHLDEFLLAAVIVLAATAVFVALFKRLGLGAVLGFLASGVLVGPAGFAITSDVEGLRHFTELGVVLFLFIVGLEMQPSKLWAMRRAVFGLGSLQIVVTGAVIGGYLLLDDVPWKPAMILGLGFALSSTAFVLQMLGEKGELGTAHGQSSFAVLLMQDMAIVPLLALVPMLAEGPATEASDSGWQEAALIIGSVAGVIGVGRYVIPFGLAVAARGRNKEAFIMVALLAALGAAYAMELIGVSMALGAFLVGMTLSASDYRHQVEAAVEPFKGLLIGLFFISVGMSIDLGLLADQWPLVLEAVVALLVLKVLTLIGLGLALGLGREVAIRTAFILCQCGEFGFVLFGAAVGAGVLADGEFGLALLIVTLTMIVTPFMAQAGERIAARFATDGATEASVDAPGEHLEDQVVVAGYGRGGRIVCLMLEKNDVPFLAYDLDPKNVARGKELGHAVHFGDVADPAVLEGAGLGSARAVVVALDEPEAAERILSLVRNAYPSLRVIARAKTIEIADDLLTRGVHRAVPEAIEASIRLGRAVLEDVGMSDSDLETVTDQFRREDYALIRGLVGT